MVNCSGNQENAVKTILSIWDTRLKSVQKTLKIIDPILNVRKTLVDIIKTQFTGHQSILDALNTYSSDCWLYVAKLASK